MAWDNRPSNPLSAEHRRLRPFILARDRHECQARGPKCTGVATEVDHIKNRRDHGEDDSLSNYQSLCHNCHAAKTQRESFASRQRRRKDLKHSWTRIKHPGLTDD